MRRRYTVFTYGSVVRIGWAVNRVVLRNKIITSDRNYKLSLSLKAKTLGINDSRRTIAFLFVFFLQCHIYACRVYMTQPLIGIDIDDSP